MSGDYYAPQVFLLLRLSSSIVEYILRGIPSFGIRHSGFIEWYAKFHRVEFHRVVGPVSFRGLKTFVEPSFIASFFFNRFP